MDPFNPFMTFIWKINQLHNVFASAHPALKIKKMLLNSQFNTFLISLKLDTRRTSPSRGGAYEKKKWMAHKRGFFKGKNITKVYCYK